MALTLKKLVSRSSSVVVPYLRRLSNHRRPFMSEIKSILEELSPRNIIFGECSSSTALRITSRILCKKPHTVRVTSRVTGEEAERVRRHVSMTMLMQLIGKEALPVLSGGDEDVTLGTSIKFSIHIPGIHKFTDTPEELYIFIDLGLNKNWEVDDLDDNVFRAILIDDNGLKNILFVEGYVQKLDIRRNYTALVCLPPHINANSTSFMVEPQNGGVVVTIPKRQETAQRLLE